MLSIEAKRYIEGNVKTQYQEIDKRENNNITLRKKIENFDRFLDLYSKKPQYKDDLEPMIEEIERVAREQGMMSFYKVAKIDTILNILSEIFNIRISENQNKAEILKELEIIKDSKLFDEIFILDNMDNLVISKEQMNEACKILENKNRKNLIPYIKAFYINQLEDEFKRIEDKKMPINIYWTYISNLFLAYIELAYIAKEQIMSQYATEKLHIKEYLQEIIKKYEEKINFKYIPSSVIKFNEDGAINDSDEEETTLPFIEINQSETMNRIKLIGYAGVGKTTTLEYIEYQDSVNYENNKKIPVIISLITVDKNEPIEKFIVRKLKMEENDDNIEIVNYLLEKGKINLYLDGVNEISISDYNLKRDFLNELEKFVTEEKTKNTKIIVTDRDNSEVSVLNNVDTFLIQGMTESDIEAFIEGNAIPEKVEEIKKVIKENSDFLGMIVNPIMLKDLITIIECGEPIPKDIEELSEVYLNTIIKREIEEKKDPLASYIDGALTYMVKRAITKDDGRERDWTSNTPTSYYRVIETFYDYAKKNNINSEDFDAEELLNLIRKMGILKEVEFQKYAFSDEKFFHIYYYNATLI